MGALAVVSVSGCATTGPVGLEAAAAAAALLRCARGLKAMPEPTGRPSSCDTDSAGPACMPAAASAAEVAEMAAYTHEMIKSDCNSVAMAGREAIL